MARVFITGSSSVLGLMAGQLLIEHGHRVVLHRPRSDESQCGCGERVGRRSSRGWRSFPHFTNAIRRGAGESAGPFRRCDSQCWRRLSRTTYGYRRWHTARLRHQCIGAIRTDSAHSTAEPPRLPEFPHPRKRCGQPGRSAVDAETVAAHASIRGK